MTTTTRFIATPLAVHLSLSSAPYHTLCGLRFTAEGKADPRAHDYELARAQEPFLETDIFDSVTCSACAEIIEAVRTTRTDPIELDPDALKIDPDYPGPDDKRR